MRWPTEHIGNPRGRIALWLDERDALDMAQTYGPSDAAYDELMQAVERAYPKAAPTGEAPQANQEKD